ncbi:MAG TPA: hypothetical protein VFV67_06065 [Actinophytocola sp.]|uniref:hypothetical protein n=1 Tax=Actinophytocola sp. TaxID=1872138 RepID=UPI002DB784AC|nr:hypothetical protein [Actinophytocola sp.]HEU5470200.1 hypothetical protein [Actinophytocola sp.]
MRPEPSVTPARPNPPAALRTPPPTSSPRRPRPVRQLRGPIAAGAVLVLIMMAIMIGRSGTSTSAPPTPQAVPPVIPAPGNAVVAPPATPTTTTTTSRVPEVTDAATAKAELERQVVADRPAVESLVGYWVPQLSGKRPGLVANGITYNYVEILRDHRSLKARYPGAKLLWSGDFTSFKYPDFWITIQSSTYPDGASANTWCNAELIPRDDCYAKLISHTQPYEGSTQLRPK